MTPAPIDLIPQLVRGLHAQRDLLLRAHQEERDHATCRQIWRMGVDIAETISHLQTLTGETLPTAEKLLQERGLIPAGTTAAAPDILSELGEAIEELHADGRHSPRLITLLAAARAEIRALRGQQPTPDGPAELPLHSSGVSAARSLAPTSGGPMSQPQESAPTAATVRAEPYVEICVDAIRRYATPQECEAIIQRLTAPSSSPGTSDEGGPESLPGRLPESGS